MSMKNSKLFRPSCKFGICYSLSSFFVSYCTSDVRILLHIQQGSKCSLEMHFKMRHELTSCPLVKGVYKEDLPLCYC